MTEPKFTIYIVAGVYSIFHFYFTSIFFTYIGTFIKYMYNEFPKDCKVHDPFEFISPPAYSHNTNRHIVHPKHGTH